MADSDAIDMMRQLLTFSPVKRMTANQALAHPYVAQFHVPEEEIECKKNITIPIDDNTKLSVSAYRDELYTSIIKVNVENQKAKAAATAAAVPAKKKKTKTARPRKERREKKPVVHE
jgi:mitogen-activated protein kinase 15